MSLFDVNLILTRMSQIIEFDNILIYAFKQNENNKKKIFLF